jgi:hypothetical protein
MRTGSVVTSLLTGAQITRLALQRGFDELGIEEVTIALPYTRSPEQVLARLTRGSAAWSPNLAPADGDSEVQRALRDHDGSCRAGPEVVGYETCRRRYPAVRR